MLCNQLKKININFTNITFEWFSFSMQNFFEIKKIFKLS